jgi:dihydrofolate reductase
MRTLSIVEFVTLDGVMQSLGSPDEDRDGGFEHGGGAEDVTTRTLTRVGWSNARILDGELVPAVRKLKREGDGAVVVLGGGVLVQELIANHLVDRYRLFVHPLLMGTGKRLFREFDRPRPLRLATCEQTATGVLMLTYEAA